MRVILFVGTLYNYNAQVLFLVPLIHRQLDHARLVVAGAVGVLAVDMHDVIAKLLTFDTLAMLISHLTKP